MSSRGKFFAIFNSILNLSINLKCGIRTFFRHAWAQKQLLSMNLSHEVTEGGAPPK
jgi:hypothetical protein